MLFYQLQPRVFLTPKNVPLPFPSTMRVEFTLGPLSAFGGATGWCPTANAAGDIEVRYDPFSGRADYRSTPPLAAIHAITRSNGELLTFNGNKIIYEGPCETSRVLTACVSNYYYTLPLLMNIELAEPPYVEKVEGSVGEVPFRWCYKENNVQLYPVSEPDLSSFFEHLPFVQRTIDKRIAASLNYYHVACRLLCTGCTVWEFMSEVVLNMSKSLEILFGNSMDSVRSGLKDLGYSSDEIEGDFIPLMVLRNHFDVGHPQLAFPKIEQSQILYRFLLKAQFQHKYFYKRLMQRLSDGRYTTTYEDPELSAKEQRKFESLIAIISKRLTTNP